MDLLNENNMKADILQILHEEASTQYNQDGPNTRAIDSEEFDTVANQILNLFKKEGDKKYSITDFLGMIEEFREKELPNRNEPYHYEAEIAAGLKHFEIFVKGK